MLESPQSDAALSQGDIIGAAPLLKLPRKLDLTGGGSKIRIDPKSTQSGEDLAGLSGMKLQGTVGVSVGPAVVVTQTCDIAHRESVTLAEIHRLDKLVKEARWAIEQKEPLVLFETVRALTEGSAHTALVYMGAPDTVNSPDPVYWVADLSRVHSFTKTWVPFLQSQRQYCISSEGLRYFQGRLAAASGRYAAAHGFWYTDEFRDSARKIEADREALDQAYRRLKDDTGLV